MVEKLANNRRRLAFFEHSMSDIRMVFSVAFVVCTTRFCSSQVWRGHENSLFFLKRLGRSTRNITAYL